MTMHSRRTLSPNILCVGDSLTAGTGALVGSEYYPSVLGTLFNPPRAVFGYGVGGETAEQILTRVTNFGPAELREILVIWAGRNGVLSVAASEIVADIQEMADRALDDRYLVLTVPFKTDGTEDAEDANGITVAALNTLILSTFGDRAVDIATLAGRDDAKRADGLHFLPSLQADTAEAVYDKIVEMGW